jgi:hypothetical protein
MNAGTTTEQPAVAAGDGGGRRSWATARVAALVAALAAVALLTVACSGSASTAGSSGAASARLARALAFAHCMRSHGAPNFPDPNSSGVWMVNPSNHAKFDAPQPTRAACAHLRLQGVQAAGTPAEQAQQQRQQLAFVACMHKDGFPQLPDSWDGNMGQLISAGIDTKSPRLNAAMTKCGSW